MGYTINFPPPTFISHTLHPHNMAGQEVTWAQSLPNLPAEENPPPSVRIHKPIEWGIPELGVKQYRDMVEKMIWGVSPPDTIDIEIRHVNYLPCITPMLISNVYLKELPRRTQRSGTLLREEAGKPPI